jgi:hypothetical protein
VVALPNEPPAAWFRTRLDVATPFSPRKRATTDVDSSFGLKMSIAVEKKLLSAPSAR